MKVLDLFCGAGGFSKGFKQAGFDVSVAIDFDEKSLIAHEANHPDTEHFQLEIGKDDLSFLSGYDFGVVIGSPPCQNFSTTNIRKNPKEGMKLIHEFIKIVKRIKPKYWIGENVLGSKSYIEKLGYKGRLLNSVYFGVPQKRIRYFFGKYEKPIATHYEYKQYDLEGNILKKWLHIEDILEDIDDWKEYNELPKNAQKRLVRFQGYPHSRVVFPNEPIGTVTAHGDTKKMLLTQTSNSNSNGMMIKTIDNPTFTITTSKDQVIIDPNQFRYRYFTEIEFKRLMGFPDNYYFHGGSVSRTRQLGNAVCPPVAKALALALL